MSPNHVPDATFHIRVQKTDETGETTFVWDTRTSAEIFESRRVVLFGVPGAFTPACSEEHLPGFEAHHAALTAQGVDEVICLSVNDAFVMRQWGRSTGVESVTMLPDGNGEFTRKMGMLVDRAAQGLGMRSWRYAMLVEDRSITRLFSEAGFGDNPAGVPLEFSSAEVMLDYLKARG